MRFSGRDLVLTLLALLLGCGGAGVFGQTPSSAPDAPASLFVPPPRELTTRLLTAQRAAQQQQWSDAIENVGSILTGQPAVAATDPAQDYFLLDRQGKLLGSARQYAADLVGRLPAAGQRLYQLRYGQLADRQLKLAQQTQDLALLADIARRYVHTEAGYQAAFLLAQLQLDQSDPWAAARGLEELQRWPQARQLLDPQLTVWLAAAWLYAGRPQRSEELLMQWSQSFPEGLRLGGKPVARFTSRAEVIPWLGQWLAEVHAHVHAPEEWVMHRGNAQRNSPSPGGLPLSRPRWRMRLNVDPADAELTREIRTSFVREGVAAVPTLQPLGARSLILTRTTDELVAVDLQSGKRIWRYPPWRSDELAQLVQELAPQQQRSRTLDLKATELSQRIWSDASMGQISSDSETVYLLEHEDSPPASSMPLVARARAAGSAIVLTALDLRSQGKVKWRVGGSEPREPQLAGAQFLGPPLPYERVLYALCEFRGEIQMVALDPQNGRLMWRQQLAHMEDQVVRNDLFRRLAGASPSASGGLLICPTSGGVAVAIDCQLRTLKWAYTYSTFRDRGGSATRHTRPTPRQPYWLDAAAIIAEDRVLLTPPDSENLHCLDLFSGRPAWPPRERGDFLYIGCVHQQKVILIGNASVQALRLSDGQLDWAQPLLLPAPPTGRGFLHEHYYYLPLASQRLWRIDLQRGVVDQEIALPHALGNLICYRNQMISLSAQWLAAYHLLEPLQQRVASTLQQDPEDRWARLRQAELLSDAGRDQEALDLLWKLRRESPDDVETRALLVDCCLDVLESNFDSGQAAAARVQDMLLGPERLRYWRLMLQGRRAQGHIGAAIEAAQRIRDELVRRPQKEKLAVEAFRRVEATRWLGSQLSDLWLEASSDPAARTAIDQWAERALNDARDQDAAQEWRWLVELFHAHPIDAIVRLEFAQRQLKHEQWLEAELLLQPLIDHADPSIRVEAAGLQAAVLQAADRRQALASLVPVLAGELADARDRHGRTGRQWLQSLGLASSPNLEQAAGLLWPPGRWTQQQAGESGLSYNQRSYPIAAQFADSPMHPDVARYTTVLERPSTLMIRDAWGQPLQALSLTTSYLNSSAHLSWQVQWSGHLLIAGLLSPGAESQLVAIDALRNRDDIEAAVMWRASLSAAAPGQPAVRRASKLLELPLGLSRVFPADPQGRPMASLGPHGDWGVVFRCGSELTCRNPITGELLWERSDIESGSDLIGDGDLLLACLPDQDVARVFRARDGLELRRCKAPRLDKRISAWRSNVLSFEASPESVTLRLTNLLSQQVLWEKLVTREAQAALLDDDQFAVTDNDGQLWIVSLRDGAEIAHQRLDPLAELSRLYVLRCPDRFLVIRNSKHVVVAPGRTFSAAPSVAHAELINGEIDCLDSRTGARLWPSAVRVEQFSVPMDQPPDLPVLVLMRNERRGNTPTSRVVLLRKQDGAVATELTMDEKMLSSYRVQAEPQLRRLTLDVPAGRYVFQWSGGDTPPAPPAALFVHPAGRAPSMRDVTGKMLDNIQRQLGAPPIGDNPFGN